MEKNYIFTREVKRWGVEAGDYYNPARHQIVGGTEKLLQDGVIEEEVDEEIKQQCGECGSTTNAIVAQCLKCGCAVCEKCPDHEAKC